MKLKEFYQQQFADHVKLFELFIEDWDAEKDLDFDEDEEVHLFQ